MRNICAYIHCLSQLKVRAIRNHIMNIQLVLLFNCPALFYMQIITYTHTHMHTHAWHTPGSLGCASGVLGIKCCLGIKSSQG